MSQRSLGVFEMLWDCAYCGTTGLLGLSHRHCPRCGAPQDPARRYFPNDASKVAVKDHVFSGADRQCAACDSPNSARSAYCVNCGAPLAGAVEVGRRPDEAAAAGPDFRAAAPGAAAGSPAATPAAADRSGRGRRWALGCLGVALVLVLLVVVAALWKKPASLAVAGHSWSREIAVETLAPRGETAWCDEMPRDAYSVTRSREVRRHERVAAGQDCRTERSDRGDGTYEEREVCETRWREEPVYDQRCRFQVDRWTVTRTATASGDALEPAPAWPDPGPLRTCAGRGCQREGARRERYLVRVAEPEGGTHDCEVEQARWTTFTPGSRWSGRKRALTGALDCDSLAPLER